MGTHQSLLHLNTYSRLLYPFIPRTSCKGGNADRVVYANHIFLAVSLSPNLCVCVSVYIV